MSDSEGQKRKGIPASPRHKKLETLEHLAEAQYLDIVTAPAMRELAAEVVRLRALHPGIPPYTTEGVD